MDHALTREESVKLMQLLKLPMEQYGNFPLMRRAFLEQCKVLHPDKGGNAELAKELISLYRKLEAVIPPLNPNDSFTTEQIPPYGTPEWEQWWQNFNKDFDIYCDEEIPDSDDEEIPRKRSQSHDDEDSQATPPKKPREEHRDMPEDLAEYLSNAILSNKTITCFLIFTTLEKSTLLYSKLMQKFKATFISRHKLHGNGLVYLITPSKHRVSAIYNFCANFCSVSFIIVKGVNKEYALYTRLCGDPYILMQENIKGGLSTEFFDAPEEAQKNVSWKMIAEYASNIGCDDVFLLLGLYLEFANEVASCKKCDEKIVSDHFEYHKDHHSNAVLFVDCKNQKAICQQAVDGVLAQKRVETSQLTRKEQLERRFKNHFEKMELLFGARSSVDLNYYMAGVAWFQCLFPGQDIKDLILEFLECMVDNIPKRRFWLFIGPVNTGKTTLAAALLDLCGGKSLNVNMPFDKINFELGVAIDQFLVVFEDVKGSKSDNKDLPTGQGINNLDNLRDHLDGAVKVNLEKKHLNKKTQIFPPGIVTCNEYYIPVTLRVRFCRKLRFSFNRNQFFALKRTPQLSRYRVLQNGITLLLLLIYHCETEEFEESLQKLVVKWKQRIDEEVGDSKYLLMKERCEGGNCMLDTPGEGSQNTEDTNIVDDSIIY
ncbi:large T antigen [Polyomavirus sp.]|uniref:large T antigen n=1 Tax=Polyomavirus sp. TaxID=36362 RepID=UPI0008DBBD12|nr:large T antigen [Polyomavirus sp.]AOW44159.1 large T antigen [Polyomavirus sp.]